MRPIFPELPPEFQTETDTCLNSPEALQKFLNIALVYSIPNAIPTLDQPYPKHKFLQVREKRGLLGVGIFSQKQGTLLGLEGKDMLNKAFS